MNDNTDPSSTNPPEVKETEKSEFEALTGDSAEKEKKEKIRRSNLLKITLST